MSLNVLWGSLSIIHIYFWFKDYNKELLPLYIFIWIHEAVVLTLYLVLRHIQNKDGANKDYLEPFILRTKLRTFAQLLDEISASLPLEENDCGGYYTFEKRLSKYLCIIIYMQSYQEDEYWNLRAYNTFYARESCRVFFKDDFSAARKNIQIYFNVFNSFDDEIKDKSRRNAKSVCDTYMEGTFDVYFELSTGKLYIPAYVSTFGYGGAVYYKAVRYLEKLIPEGCLSE